MFDQHDHSGFSVAWICAGLLFVSIATGIFAQTTEPAAPSVAPLQGGWEDIDQRFVFLTVELSSVEASLNSITHALAGAGREQDKAKQLAQSHAADNYRMDRQGGGPMDWQDFYGKTAKSFYYHASASIDMQGQSNFKLHAEAGGKQLTAIDRPPQFDYIYHANTEAQKSAETNTAKLGNKIDALLARRQQLEAEQSALWCKIALRGLSTEQLAAKPLYRFEPAVHGDNPDKAQRLAAISAACKFMRTIGLIVKQSQPALDGDQQAVYKQVQTAVAAAGDDLDNALLTQIALEKTLSDPQTPLGQFNKAAKRLEDSSQNLCDAYRLAAEGDSSGDDQRKERFRAQFQQTAMDFASTVITANDAITIAAADWNISPDNSKPVVPDSKPLIVNVPLPPRASVPVQAPANQTASASASDRSASPDQMYLSPSQGQSPSEMPTAFKPADQQAIGAERAKVAAQQTRPLGVDPFKTDQTLSQVDQPYAIAGSFQPVADAPATLKIAVRPGVEIRGGKIDLRPPTGRKNAQITLAGTELKPIILRNVEIDQPLGGSFTANYVIFDQCTFRKSGAWFSYYSSKWDMNHCLLYKCTIPTLNGVNFGFHLNNCSLVGMDLPEISHRHDDESGFDYMSRLRKDWNIIKSCNFVDCTILPTVFWCSENSNFWGCSFMPGVAFKSDSEIHVVAYVSAPTGQTPEQILKDNPPARGGLTYDLRSVPFAAPRFLADCPIPEIRLDERYARLVLGTP